MGKQEGPDSPLGTWAGTQHVRAPLENAAYVVTVAGQQCRRGRLGSRAIGISLWMQGALLVLPKPSMRAQELRLSVLLEMVCARDVHTGNMCRRVGSRALRVGITHPASCLLAASRGQGCPGPQSPSSLKQAMPLLGPSLVLWHPSAPSCCPFWQIRF